MPKSLKTSSAFPAERPTAAQNEQDAFLDMHGGTGPRALFRCIEAIVAGGSVLARLPTLVAALPGRFCLSRMPKRRRST